MCVLSIKVPIRKKSGNLFNDPFKLLASVVEGDQKAPFSKAITQRCWGGGYSFSRMAPLYPLYVPYIVECWAITYQVPSLKYLVWLDRIIGEHSIHWTNGIKYPYLILIVYIQLYSRPGEYADFISAEGQEPSISTTGVLSMIQNCIWWSDSYSYWGMWSTVALLSVLSTTYSLTKYIYLIYQCKPDLAVR